MWSGRCMLQAPVTCRYGKSCRTLFGWPWPRGSKEKRAEKRKMIEEEIKKGYLQEFNDFRKNKGKQFEASSDLEPRDRAIKFPPVNGTSISGDALTLPFQQVSLVLVSMKEMGMHMCKQYLKSLEKETELADRVKIVEISLLDNRLYSILLKHTIERNLCRSIPPNRHCNFMIYSGKGTSEIKRAIAVHNSIVGYAYLLDKEGLIRWRAHATPTDKELQTLIKCTKELLDNSL